ncbi:cytosolic purine 5'-nucleotidase-like [Pecten maximus]|uniref:cytosolic purine 5'-nucleotidase-like n=1 Tax=Pecten maximus TaxID=6579 RepID=UPI001458C4F1|nr:cytosolic purine 5'-nucleotidase-like [Pecten maximus]XP_033757254.1 cytosolic purine 5'-nucleotidase-like [Pecten maximus]XP_033757255.1 cytosolic purine 5'-nucleotidase-like [Pecten maximus]
MLTPENMPSSPVKRDHSGNFVNMNGSTTHVDGGSSKMHVYKRRPSHRIFVNRALHLEKISVYGFDMDYTLAVYKSPEYEAMGFDMLKQRLVTIGYPEAINEFEYDPTFACRGLWFDKQYGNLLKVDAYGNILVCVHGFKFLKGHEVSKLYPNKYIQLDENRIYVLNTLFNLPETYMIACIIDYFNSSKDYISNVNGVKCNDLFMSYRSIFQDMRACVDWIHEHGPLKEDTVKNMEKFVHKDKRLPLLLNRMREHGAKTMIITNSDYTYSNKIMEYLLDFPDLPGPKRDWTSYFDIVVVSAKKPLFFKEGTIMRKVDRDTGKLSLGHHLGPMKQGCVYSGGSCDLISQMLGVNGKNVLYVGDHIFGDILRSKKEWGWRTFLVVPELQQEVRVWTEKRELFHRLESLECEMGEKYRNLDSSHMEKPDIHGIQRSMMETVHELDQSYGMLGSLFRSGSRPTFFAAQVQRYADIYCGDWLNMLHYPFTYMFRAPSMLMPHESTVGHELSFEVDNEEINNHRLNSVSSDKLSNGMHLRADRPKKVTHHHDDDDFEDETSSTGSD